MDHGLLAFPLLELGRMEEAAAASRKGFEINKEYAWAHHCVSYITLSLCILYSQFPCNNCHSVVFTNDVFYLSYLFVAVVSCSST